MRELTISVPHRHVTIRGKEVLLKNREFELLLFLGSNPGIVFSKDVLFDRIWGMDAVGDTATVMVHVNRIREKIEKIIHNSQCLTPTSEGDVRMRSIFLSENDESGLVTEYCPVD